MDRRDALSRAAILLGCAISAPTIAAILAGCNTESKAASGYLTPELEALVAELCDIILPKTTTPSASEAGVPSFVHTVMTECTPHAERDAFVRGIKSLTMGKGNFAKLTPDSKMTFLQQLDKSARAAREKADETQAAWRKLKELTVVGYFTSEIGASQVLDYVPVPGKWEPCVPLVEGQRAFAL